MATKSSKYQHERFAAVLADLKKDVTPEDKTKAATELDVAMATVLRYLNGEVLNNDTAVSLITFFKKRIADREKAIA